MTDKKYQLKTGDGEGSITSSELEYILEVNKKSIEINIEVAKQNEQTLSTLDRLEEKIDAINDKQKDHMRLDAEGFKIIEEAKDTIDEIKKLSEETNKTLKDAIEKKVEEIEKNLFRLVIILGSAGIGTLLTIIQAFLHK